MDGKKGFLKGGNRAAESGEISQNGDALRNGAGSDKKTNAAAGRQRKKDRAVCGGANTGVRRRTKAQARTDMAVEFYKGAHSVEENGVKKTEVVVDEKLSARLNRPQGRYITVESAATSVCDREAYKPLIEALARCIQSLAPDCETFLAVGVGNPLLTADALGSRAVSLLKVNRGFSCRRIGKELSAFSPNVSGVTGIESADVVKSVCAVVKPDCVILIDSLASAAVSRLGTAFQLCDCGLVPGSGVAGGKQPLNAKSLKVKKAVSVGVPLVVYAETIIRDALKGEVSAEIESGFKELLVTPKDIDLLMSECAHVIAESINKALEL